MRSFLIYGLLESIHKRNKIVGNQLLIMSEEPQTFSIIISGKVQGVFFRASMKKIAEANNVVGWVRNLENGGVEALVQGKGSDVVTVLDWCKVGPRNSVVADVKVTKLKAEPALRNFAVLL